MVKSERDQYRDELKEMVDVKVRMEKEKVYTTFRTKEQMNKLDM